MKVHLLNPPDSASLAELQSHLLPTIHLESGQVHSPAGFEILVAGRPSRPDLEASPHLHTLVIPFAGLPPQTRTLLLDFPQIAVHNLHHNAVITAEVAIALLFAAAKFLVPFDRALRQHDWTRRYQPNPSMLLRGKTILILGFGAIGQHIGKVCHALGMTVVGVRRQPGIPAGLGYPADVHTLKELPGLLPKTHVLVIALPDTPHTGGLLGESELRALPPGAILVNVGRAAIVDQAALYRALADGHLRAAGLDVWYHYPANPEHYSHTSPADFPFHTLDNVVLSPHRGGMVDETESLRMRALADLLNAAAQGQPLTGKVNVQEGY